jgi:hypothetical protein
MEIAGDLGTFVKSLNVRHFPTFVAGNGAADGCDISSGTFATGLIKYTTNQSIFIDANIADFNRMLKIVHKERKSFGTLEKLAAAEPDWVLPYQPKPVAATAKAAAETSTAGIWDVDDDLE